MVDKTALTRVAMVAAKMALYTVIITATVLAIDVVGLWSLNLLADVGLWNNLLLVEGMIMAVLGVADVASGLGGAISPGGIRLPQARSRARHRHIWFWLSVGIAGVILFFLSSVR